MSINQKALVTIETLPERVAETYARNAAGLSGTTVEMNAAGGGIIATLQLLWIDIAMAAFPPHAFNGSAEDWMRKYVDCQMVLYATLSEPAGPGTGGTIVRQITAGDLINDLEALIEKTVKSLFCPELADEYENWLSRWNASRGSSTTNV